MSLIVLGSAKGSPGATTLAVLLARSLARQASLRYPSCFLVDCDPDGGDIAVSLGLDPAPGVATLALAGRHGFDGSTLTEHAQRTSLLPGVGVVVGIAGASQRGAIEWLAEPMSAEAQQSDRDHVVDVGRLGASTPAVAVVRSADHVLLVCRSDTASLVHARSALGALSDLGAEAAPVVVGPGRNVGELGSALGKPVAAVLPLQARSHGVVPPTARRWAVPCAGTTRFAELSSAADELAALVKGDRELARS